MAQVHTFIVDTKYGVPDRLVREFLNECEKEMGLIRVFMHNVQSPTANLLTVVVMRDELEPAPVQ